MIKYFIIIFLVTLTIKTIASPVLTDFNYVIPAPPKESDDKSLYLYLNNLYNRWNTLQVTTTSPNGNITSNFGNIIIYYDATDYWLAVETTKPKGTTWKGIKLGVV